MKTRNLLGVALAAALSACSGGGSSSDAGPLRALGSEESPPLVPVQADRDGTSFRQEIIAPTGDSVIFQVFEPVRLETLRSYPLVLHGHGYAGKREEEKRGLIGRLVDSGYYVISIDQRGFGESGGTVRVMSPDFEGRNLTAILDWAENLEGLRRRSNGEMMVGSFGGSYGGIYQLLLYAVDPRHRLRVLAPDITPHDLVYSLNPNDVIKSGWALLLALGAELPLTSVITGGNPAEGIPPALAALAERGQLRQDPVIYETLVQGVLTNRFSEPGRNMFAYHSFRYWCDGVPAAPQHFVLATPDPRAFPPTPPPAADVLLTQGFLDTLFNFNDGLNNYECLKGLGGDVRLLTHQSGHILPVSLGTAGLEEPLDPFYAALTFPEFQDGGESGNCGTIDVDAVRFAWFEEKLQGKNGAIGDVLPTGDDVCLSLAEGDAVEVAAVKRGGESFAIASSTPGFSSALGVLGAILGTTAREALLADQTILTVPAGGAIVGGLPLLDVTVEGVSGLEMAECALPVLSLGCDPILFLAIGRRPPGQTRWEIIDDQLTPIRGFGHHQIEMSGIAERLGEGDEVGFLVYGFHAQYPVSWSRDLFVPAVTVSGSVELPLLGPADIVRDGV